MSQVAEERSKENVIMAQPGATLSHLIIYKEKIN
jgi:hypothetical protein